MSIYRGDGGAGDATNDVSVNQITAYSIAAQTAAVEAAASATSATTNAASATSSAAAAATSATNAAASASSASTSATTATTQASNAGASATAASASATSAATSASNASTSASTASTQASNASTSATAAASSASAASTSATNAAASATTATTQATNAASSATSASTSASTATTQAGIATTQASNASTSASNAATSATNAASSATAAAASAASINDANIVHKTGDETVAGIKTFSSNPIVSSGTANGVAYLNGSKVLTTGTVLTFNGSLLSAGNISTLGSVQFSANTSQAAGSLSRNATYGLTYFGITGSSYDGAFLTNSGSVAFGYSSSGNLGVGVVPSAWSQGKAIELLSPGMGLWNGSGTPGSIYMTGNAYFNAGFKYGVTSQASTYYQYLGQHIWSNAPSGTAGAAITFTQAMTLDASGNLLVGTTTNTNSSKAVVAGVIETTSGGVRFPDASVQTTAATGFGFKNRIINGDMRINQRAIGAQVPLAAGVYLADRWFYNANQSTRFNAVDATISTLDGFSNYLSFTSNGAFSPAAGDWQCEEQIIEGFNISDLGWGTVNAKAVTLSFRVNSSLTGTFSGAIVNGGTTRSYPFTFSIPVANTWTTISVNIAGDTTGTWANDNTAGLRVRFNLGTGTTYLGTAGSWAGTQYFGVTGSVNVCGTSGATFYITGVQLEKGSTATAFDYRPYGTELALCQRYLPCITAGVAGANGFVCNGFAQSTSLANLIYPFKVTPRTPPTGITAISISAFGATTQASFGNGTSITFVGASAEGCNFYLNTSSVTYVAGASIFMTTTGSPGSIQFTGCEL